MTNDMTVYVARYDEYTGEKYAQPAWYPKAEFSFERSPNGRIQALFRLACEDGGWLIAGWGNTEREAYLDLRRNLPRAKDLCG